MKILYTAPTRAHHYKYAAYLHKQALLQKFVSGFSRLSPRSPIPEIGNHLSRQDWIQTVFFASVHYGLPARVTSNLAYLAKLELDWACRKFIDDADIFMFYNGAGLHTARYAKKAHKISITEAVNSHVQFQEDLLKEEHALSNISWTPFHSKEKARRIEEYDVADYILLPSEFVKGSFLKLGYPAEKLIKVPYGFTHLGSDVPEQDNFSDTFNIVYVGSISVRKGVRYLIEAFQKFKHPNKQLTIVGQQNKPNGLNGIVIPENVKFTGVLKGDDLANVYRSANVFCLPSIEEGLALVLGEALSYGIPIIATENTGADDIITHGQEGFIVPIRDSNAITEKLQLLADDTDLYQHMRGNARSKSLGLDGWDKSCQLLENSLREIYQKQISK